MMRHHGRVPVDDDGLIEGLLGVHVVLTRARGELDRLCRESRDGGDPAATDPELVAVLLGIYALERRFVDWITACASAPSGAGATSGGEPGHATTALAVRELLR